VVLGTLVIQGLTLKPLLRLLRLHDDDPVAHEVTLARTRVVAAVAESMGGGDSNVVHAVLEEYEALLQDDPGIQSGDEESRARQDAHRRALAAARHVISQLRSNATIGDDAYHLLEEDLDRIEFAHVRD
jgi:CPA1 family monovalent cation:H+ antiporter